MDAIYSIDFFRGELDLINDSEIRRLTEEALVNAPKYIWYVPASITGKHHPPDDNDHGGLCWHLKKTAWVAYRMFDNLLLNTDVALSAGLLHDIYHRGVNDEPEEGYDSYQKHGTLAAGRAFQLAQLNPTWAMICNCIEKHMGRWGDEQPDTIYETTFHLADVAASTKGLVSVYYGENETEYGEFLSHLTTSDIVGKKEYFKEVNGELVFNFGKLEGKPLLEVVHERSSYINWILGKGIASHDNPQGFPEYMIKQIKDAEKQVWEKPKEDAIEAQGNLFAEVGDSQ